MYCPGCNCMECFGAGFAPDLASGLAPELDLDIEWDMEPDSVTEFDQGFVPDFDFERWRDSGLQIGSPALASGFDPETGASAVVYIAAPVAAPVDPAGIGIDTDRAAFDSWAFAAMVAWAVALVVVSQPMELVSPVPVVRVEAPGQSSEQTGCNPEA